MRRLVLATSLLGISLPTLRSTAQPLALGAEFRVNSYTTFQQLGPAVAEHGSGFVVCWYGNGAGETGGIFAQRYDGTGPVGGEFRVNATTSGSQDNPSVASSAGGFVIVWTGPDASARGILGQRFDSAGAPVGPEFRVNSYTTQDQSQARVAMNPSTGAFVVVWTSHEDGAGTSIAARRYDAAGAPLASSFRVNTYTTGLQTAPAVAMVKNSEFLVVWEGPGATDSSGIWARRFAADGTPQGSEFRVNSVTSLSQYRAQVSVDGGADYLVVWGGNGTGRPAISAQRFGAAGNAIGGEFLVNGGTSSAQTPGVAFHAGASFVVAWLQPDDPMSILERRVVGGVPQGSDFQVNTYTTGYRAYPVVTRLDVRNFTVVWNGEGVSDSSGVFARRLCFPKGDVNFDGTIDVLDVFRLVNYLFAGGAPPVCT